jgi:hypothetical protein
VSVLVEVTVSVSVVIVVPRSESQKVAPVLAERRPRTETTFAEVQNATPCQGLTF